MSAIPPKADIAERRCHVRFVPKADISLGRASVRTNSHSLFNVYALRPESALEERDRRTAYYNSLNRQVNCAQAVPVLASDPLIAYYAQLYGMVPLV